MKKDTFESHILVCPIKDKAVSYKMSEDAGFVRCPLCGFQYKDDTLEHIKTRKGHWVRPNLFEELFTKRRQYFLSHENIRYELPDY